ncbi:hypothetical protein O6H91_16G022300 [Diphasiastrum complanatum]|uniref:Uncharacterized protein n=1 Tax=Diphasiastrum complanatum TaxID=34168 RepID=A0ACC2BAI6_DIPCM|nr:hypothetical protein O6H91_16G022300 [Diphasiastrum complanatum]
MVPLCLPCAAAGVGRLSWCAGDLTIVKKGASISIVPEFGSGFWRGYKFASCLQFTMSTQTRKTGIVASASHESIAGTDQRQWVLLRKTLGAWVKPYLEKNSLVVAALNLISAHDGSPVTYDHVAFRTFGEIIKKYTGNAAPAIKYPVLAGVLNSLPWPTPHFAEYQQLASESEYAAWTLVNGYTLNHLTVSVHRLSKLRKIEMLNQLLLDHDIRLNTEGGTLKVSPDGGLQQSSTVADSASFTFADGEVKTVPASYLEFAERLVLPRFKNIPENEVREWHRRDGFEVGNADKIFASTFSDQTGVQ